MAVETLPPPGADAEASRDGGREGVRDGVIEHSDPERIVRPSEFSARAEDIFRGINYLRDQGATESEAYSQVSATYIYEEENPELAALSDVILAVPAIAHEERRLEELRAQYRLNGDRSNHDEYQDITRLLVSYNHRLRDLIYNNPHGFSRADLTAWLEKGDGSGSERMAGIVSGVAAEVAIKKELNAIPEVASSRFATIEEDANGTDLVATFQNGTTRGIDVKHGQEAVMEGLDRRRSDTAIIGVNHDDLEEFRVRRESRAAVRKMLLAAGGMA